MSLKILFFGDIIGKIGRRALEKILPRLREEYKPDLIIANAENLAHGLGVTKKTCQEVLEAGIDILTSGNHIWKKDEVYEIFAEKTIPLIRPANYPPGVPGEGLKIIEVGTKKVLMVNLLGRVFMNQDFDCPFRKIDEILAEYKNNDFAAILVDFHGEATSERWALGWYLDGRVSAILGTHTHVATADEQILPQGTAYVTDIGMVGAKEAVIGIDKKNILKMFLTQITTSHEIPEAGVCLVNAIFVEIDSHSSKAIKIRRIDQEVEV